MRQHGLTGWQFRFDHARRRFGCCHITRQLITLSRPLAMLNGVEQVTDTLLHEIAHALTPGDGHGAKWKAACRRLGAKPVRCYGDDAVVSPPRAMAKYRVGCLACGWWVERRRLSRRKLVCRQCGAGVVYQHRTNCSMRGTP
jgi:predicted SprT family Zn-dependent metalloprotease